MGIVQVQQKSRWHTVERTIRLESELEELHLEFARAYKK